MRAYLGRSSFGASVLIPEKLDAGVMPVVSDWIGINKCADCHSIVGDKQNIAIIASIDGLLALSRIPVDRHVNTIILYMIRDVDITDAVSLRIISNDLKSITINGLQRRLYFVYPALDLYTAPDYEIGKCSIPGSVPHFHKTSHVKSMQMESVQSEEVLVSINIDADFENCIDSLYKMTFYDKNLTAFGIPKCLEDAIPGIKIIGRFLNEAATYKYEALPELEQYQFVHEKRFTYSHECSNCENITQCSGLNRDWLGKKFKGVRSVINGFSVD